MCGYSEDKEGDNSLPPAGQKSDAFWRALLYIYCMTARTWFSVLEEGLKVFLMLKRAWFTNFLYYFGFCLMSAFFLLFLQTLQPWGSRCCSVFLFTDVAKSAVRADSVPLLQVSSNTNTWYLNRSNNPKPDTPTSCVLLAVPIEETKPRLCSTTSWGSDSEVTGSLSRNSQIYFSTKARLSFRHQLDSNINAVDATYWAALAKRHQTLWF